MSTGRSTRRRRWTIGALGVVALTAASVATGNAGAQVEVENQQAPFVPPPHKGAVELSNSILREAVLSGEAPQDVQTVGGNSVVVEVLFRAGEGSQARAAIRDVGADPGITVPGELVQAEVPLDGLVDLEADGAVRYVRPPIDYSEPADPAEVKLEVLSPGQTGAYAGEQIQKTNAASWHAAGITGQNVKVGIIDSFSGSHYNAAVAAGEIPGVSGTFCMDMGSNCTAGIFGGGRHGIGVAEAVIDMAPSAEIYFASAETASDTQAALNHFASQGVRVVTRSETGRYDGPGNGAGPIAAVIENSAVGQGMFYLNSAGNSAGRNGELGTYWRGGWSDPDADGFLNFTAADELMGFDCSYLNGLRWSDFGEGGGTTDYDFYLFNGTPAQIAAAEGSQGSSGGAQEPIERIDTYSCPAGGVAFIAIKLFSAGNGTAGDVLEVMTNGAEVEHPQNPFSASGPMADLNSAGAIAVGAVDPALGTTIANYSAEGPTNDGRMKPDLSAAACVASITYAPGCFDGTSSATPVTAGAAALALSGGAANSPQSLKNFLLSSTVDRGAGGPDNVYGVGELSLPAPPNTGGGTPVVSGGGTPVVSDGGAPVVDALRSRGKRGHFARLRYIVTDDSGQSSERIEVTLQGRTLTTIQTEVSEATGGKYAVRWNVPRRIRGVPRFCVTAADASGNTSAQSCARVKIKKRRAKR